MIVLAMALLLAADPPFEPLPATTGSCVTDVAAQFSKAPEPADVVADAVAQVCFFRQPSVGYRVCYVTSTCDGPNRQVAIEEMRRIKLQALVEMIRIRTPPSN